MYWTLFGIVVKDCVNTILKKEVLYLTVEMSRFRKNISQRMVQDESLTDAAPLKLSRLTEGFAEAWKVWREDKSNDKGELSYKALSVSVIPE